MRDKLELAKTLRRDGKFEEALGLLQSLSSSAPRDPQIQYQLAWTCDAAGKETQAVPFYEAALERARMPSMSMSAMSFASRASSRGVCGATTARSSA